MKYFVLVDAYNVAERDKLLKKIEFYKDLSKNILSQKQTILEDIDIINDVLFTNVLNEKNLSGHKDLIRKLLKIIQQKNEQIYLLTTDIEILNKEMKFWIYGYENLKHDKSLRVN